MAVSVLLIEVSNVDVTTSICWYMTIQWGRLRRKALRMLQMTLLPYALDDLIKQCITTEYQFEPEQVSKQDPLSSPWLLFQILHVFPDCGPLLLLSFACSSHWELLLTRASLHLYR